MDEHVYLLTIGLPLLAIVVVAAMRHFSAIQQAKLRFSHEEAYRVIAEKAVAAHTEAAASLASMDASLSELKSRVTAIEKILKEVE